MHRSNIKNKKKKRKKMMTKYMQQVKNPYIIVCLLEWPEPVTIVLFALSLSLSPLDRKRNIFLNL